MTISPGTRLGPYEILSALGAGGMGEVFRARDPRLGRDVAIKVLPEAFSNDAGRLRRFEQEARSAAALNHSNIVALYDVGSQDGVAYVVLELLEGQTLRDSFSSAGPSESPARLRHSPDGLSAVIAHGSLPLRRALDYAAQIARGLAAAHKRGIVHRDLKPENVWITADHHAKILDFGLAKQTPLRSSTDTDQATQLNPDSTEPGVLLGTIGYMAPEQARGLSVDHRADIFSLGIVLYEMLTGRTPFHRATAADTITAILAEDPPELPAAERHIPPSTVRIVNHCLEKDPAARFQDASDIAFALESLSDPESRDGAAGKPAVPVRRSREKAAWTIAALLALGLVATAIWLPRTAREASPKPLAVRFAVSAAEGTQFTPQATVGLSPDGRHLVFAAASGGVPGLWVRSLGELAARQLPGTDGAANPFWSSDGRWIGFFAGNTLNKIQVAGGPPLVIANTAGRDGVWHDQTILFALPTGAIHQVPAGGGAPSPVTSLAAGEIEHHMPELLPDGRHFLFVVSSGQDVSARTFTLWMGSLGSSDRVPLGPAQSNTYYSSGHLLYARGDTIMAQPYDDATRQTTGDPFQVAAPVYRDNARPRAAFAVSPAGVLAYRRGGRVARQLTWFNRKGQSEGTVAQAGTYFNLALSPDERRLAASFAPGQQGNIDVWVFDLSSSAAPFRLTTAPGPDFDPVWSTDGREVAFSAFRASAGAQRLYRRAATGTGQDELVPNLDRPASSAEWSANGQFLVFTSLGDLWVLPRAGGGQAYPLVRSAANETAPAISPDGRWVAYASDESGQRQVHLTAFAAGGGNYRISAAGGHHPRWRGDGRELFFLAPDGTLMASAIDTAQGLHASEPRPLFQTGIVAQQTDNDPYAVTRDGQRFLIPSIAPTGPIPDVVVLGNWLALARADAEPR